MEQQSNFRKQNFNLQKNKDINKIKQGKVSEKLEDGKSINIVDHENNKDVNVIFVGGKPLVNYIRGIITQFMKKNSEEVIIKSRGKFISRAVDIAEVAKRSLTEINVRVKSISISSESFEKDGKRTNISTMDIVLSK